MAISEIGTTGLQAFGGYIQAAYNSALYYPAVVPLYNRIWRSDPEVSIVRQLFDSMSAQLKAEFVSSGEDSDDQEAVEFGNQVLEEITGNFNLFLNQCLTKVPFYGWGWWEVVPGLRRAGWKSADGWQSEYNDDLIGVEKIAFRDYSSFDHWDIDDKTGRVLGFIQSDYPSPTVTIPADKSVHIRYGDTNNPEGLALLEAIWRLERIKYGLEVVQGIGYEHSAGHVKFTAEGELTAEDKDKIVAAARAILTAQEGNYMALPNKITAEVIDVDFSAAASILEAIRYYSTLKLMLFGMQWVALSATTGAGSYSAMSDSSSMAVMLYNAMAEGFIAQTDAQFGKMLFDWNTRKFPGMRARPRLQLTQKIEKIFNLAELGQFVSVIGQVLKLGDEDKLSIRRKSGFLPEIEEEEPKPEGNLSRAEDAELEQAKPSQPLIPIPGAPPTDLTYQAQVDEKDLDAAIRSFERWAKIHAPKYAKILRAKVVEE